jgi:hypothetical protein
MHEQRKGKTQKKGIPFTGISIEQTGKLANNSFRLTLIP